MKKYLSVFVLSFILVFSLSAKTKPDLLIDFIVNIYNQKEPASNENFLKHGFIKNMGGYMAAWENLTIQVWVENGSLKSFSFSSNNQQTFLSDWQKFIVYIYDTYNVKTSKGFYQNGSILEEITIYTFNNVRVLNYAPYKNVFEICYY